VLIKHTHCLLLEALLARTSGNVNLA